VIAEIAQLRSLRGPLSRVVPLTRFDPSLAGKIAM
jgi:hypothetical protein